MIATNWVILGILACISSLGCTGYRDTVRGIGHSAGGIQAVDIQQANAYRETLPNYLGLSADQVQIKPGSMVVLVTIFRVNSDLNRKRITDAISALNSQNPGLSPLSVTFR